MMKSKIKCGIQQQQHIPTCNLFVMDIYLLQSPFSMSPDFRVWRPPQVLYILGPSQQEFYLVTAGGLIRDGDTVYMLVVQDVSLMGWCSCKGSGSSARHHSSCTPVSKHIIYQQDLQQDPVGLIGSLVHYSIDQGYGLVRVNPEWFAGDEEAVAQEAIPIEQLEAHTDEPEIMDFIEFTTASGEEVTGVIVASQNHCVQSGSGRRRIAALVVNTSSYSVKPEDCGAWVRRSIASDRPMLLGHIVGFSENESYGMLLLPFNRFRDDMRRTLRRKVFNMLG
ncbi:uncharacterized protein BCR38DRAFT_447739 [Pseudomassariella vexata]|uniref:Uncharacterized protein n=1 Tax=Pseudomassariella vexata TaxID=1141098 RepID=A0A1Y2DH51_9PEZI|nr:uncharacterized protein BCR38DRAFT_447739 [Pseudomassariella vexata]ORY58591.1 hypothetical protein BCR38DRAFT_447739 [Pseudomassariella vexata]